MPTQVQNRPSETHPRGLDKYPEQDPRLVASKNLQYKSDALRLALGSILSPKRPPLNPSPRSGTASPAHFSGSSAPQTPGSAADASGSSDYLHPSHAYSHLHQAHPPSRLGRSQSKTSSNPSSAQSSSPGSPHLSPTTETSSQDDALPFFPIANSTRKSPIPADGAAAEASKSAVAEASKSATTPEQKPSSAHSSGTGTPRARFLETLQGKSAYDALVHGQFSS